MKTINKFLENLQGRYILTLLLICVFVTLASCLINLVILPLLGIHPK